MASNKWTYGIDDALWVERWRNVELLQHRQKAVQMASNKWTYGTDDALWAGTVYEVHKGMDEELIKTDAVIRVSLQQPQKQVSTII